MKNRSINRGTPLFEEVGWLFSGAYYVGVKNESVYISLNKELLKKELA